MIVVKLFMSIATKLAEVQFKTIVEPHLSKYLFSMTIFDRLFSR